MNRSEAIDKAKKLKALADRGIDGEQKNAKTKLNKIIQDHKLSDTDIDIETETHEVTTGWHIQTEKRKFLDNEIVLVYGGNKMIVEKAYVTLKGWRYIVRFINKNGTMNKRTGAWGLYAKDIQKLNQRMLLAVTPFEEKTNGA